MKAILIALSCLVLMAGSSLLIAIMWPRFFGDRDGGSSQMVDSLNNEQLATWSEDARMRWDEVVTQSASNQRAHEDRLAWISAGGILVSAGFLWRLSRLRVFEDE